jgi:hypothetical protein
MHVTGAMVTMDTSAAHLALSQIDQERSVMTGMVAAVIADFTKAYHISNVRRDELTNRLARLMALWDKEKARMHADMDQTEGKIKLTSRRTMHMVYQMASQAWQLIEMAFGASKNATSRMIGFAISAMSQIIAAGYSAAAQWAAAGPWGAAMAALNLTVIGINVAQQGTMIAQQANLDAQPGIVGNIIMGAPN